MRALAAAGGCAATCSEADITAATAGIGFTTPCTGFAGASFSASGSSGSSGGSGNSNSNADGTASNPCFPSSSLVTMADGTVTRIDALKEGDAIVAATAEGTLTTDTVSLLSIAHPDAAAASYVTLTTANTTLTLTPAHHLPVGVTCCAHLKKARDVAAGDTVWSAHRSGGLVPTPVLSTSTTKAAGLHSPVLTAGGFPLVDGLVTSFDSIEKVTLAKYGLQHLIAACKATGSCAAMRDAFLADDDRKFVAAAK